MKYFPVFVGLTGETVAVFGGGEQAAQKLRLLLKTQARLVVVAPDICAEITDLAAAGRLTHVRAVCDVNTLARARLVFAATGCAGADAAVAALARAHGRLVNVVDRPELCDLLTPAIVDRDPVVVAIGTEGAAPVLARRIKSRIEEMLEPRLGGFAAMAGALRAAVAERVAPGRRRAFWERLFEGPARRAYAQGREARARALMEAALEAEAGQKEAAGVGAGVVSLVGAGPGEADLVTLRAARLMQEADLVVYDAALGPQILELARRDAERAPAGAARGFEIAAILAAARQGRRVVRLMQGDPQTDPRAARLIGALDDAGVAWDIAPGVAAARGQARRVA